MNSIVHALKTTVWGIIFPKLDHSSMAIRGYADAGFTRNNDLSSQLSMVVALIDKYRNASLIHYATWKSRRIVRSILEAELYALSACHDYCQILAHDLQLITCNRYPLHLMTDSKSIFDTITRLSSISEKGLLIDVSALWESYTSGEIQNIGHVLSDCNLADALTKKTRSPVLNQLLKKGIITHDVNLWIIHQETPKQKK